MKTRIEFGSDHVQIICSKELAKAIGTALEIAYEEHEDMEPVELDYLWRINKALQDGTNFEEEEPTS